MDRKDTRKIVHVGSGKHRLVVQPALGKTTVQVNYDVGSYAASSKKEGKRKYIFFEPKQLLVSHALDTNKPTERGWFIEQVAIAIGRTARAGAKDFLPLSHGESGLRRIHTWPGTTQPETRITSYSGWSIETSAGFEGADPTADLEFGFSGGSGSEINMQEFEVLETTPLDGVTRWEYDMALIGGSKPKPYDTKDRTTWLSPGPLDPSVSEIGNVAGSQLTMSPEVVFDAPPECVLRLTFKIKVFARLAMLRWHRVRGVASRTTQDCRGELDVVTDLSLVDFN